jgi:predicted HTH transcriptional regulator
MLDDDSLVKHVTAFANSNGGYMIFGVEGTGKGGFPKAILGIDSEEVKRVLGPAKHGT